MLRNKYSTAAQMLVVVAASLTMGGPHFSPMRENVKIV